MKVELSNLTELSVELTNQEVLNNTKLLLLTIYDMIKGGHPSENVYLFKDVFTQINSYHKNKNYIKFEIISVDKFSNSVINLLLSYKHKYLDVFNLVHIDNNELILPIKNKRQFYNLVKLLM